VSPFRKGRNKNEKIFLIPLFLKEGQGEILCRQKSKAKKFTSYFLKTYRD